MREFDSASDLKSRREAPTLERKQMNDSGERPPSSATPGVVHSLLDEAVELHGEEVAVRDSSGAWTYQELRAHSSTVRGRLGALMVSQGSRVLCLLPGSREFTALLFGVLQQGAVLVPAVEASSKYQLQWLLTDVEPDLVVTTGDRLANVQAHTSVPVVTVSSLTERDPDIVLGTGGAPPNVEPDSPALMIYTSGSTARPKGIVCSHGTVVWTARAIASSLGYCSDDVVYNRLPVSFDYGLYQVLLCTLAGAEVFFPDGPLSAGELQAIRRNNVTVLPLVPTLALFLSQLAARDNEPSSVRLITNTGAALVGADAARVRTAFPGAALICMYGMSECKRITIAWPDEDLLHPGTVGRALAGTRLFILDDAGRALPPYKTGQIISAGPHVMSGYWANLAGDQERFIEAPDGSGRAVRTGDYGYLDHDGRLYFVGRRDDIFKRRGWRTSSQEIEGAAMDVTGVEAAVCVPPGPDGQVLIWVVAMREPREILREIGERLGAAKVPDRCVVVPKLPLTPHGKIDRAALRQLSGGSL